MEWVTGSSESFCRMSHPWLWRDPKCPAWTGSWTVSWLQPASWASAFSL